MKKSLIITLAAFWCVLLYSSAGYITLLQLISPPDLAQTLNTTPYFKFKAISNTSSTLSCTLYINSTPYGADNSVYNDTETIIQANSSLSKGYDYVWWINCSDNESAVESEKRIIGIGANFSRCAVLVDSNASYYLVGDIVDSSADVCIDIRADNVTLDCKGHMVDGIDKINSIGILFSNKNNVVVKNCKVSNWNSGIYFEGYYNEISNCKIFKNHIGINFRDSFNTVSSSLITENELYGIYFIGINNLFYNNFFNNTDNVAILYSFLFSNNWNVTKTTATNIISGINFGGNFWAKPDGTGYSQTCEDANKDGFCDKPYTLGYNNVDYLPLSKNILFNNCLQLNRSRFNYLLVNDIINSSQSYCINISANNLTLNCQNHIIDGNGAASYGIYAYRKVPQVTNITIENCVLSDWRGANIYFYQADKNILNKIITAHSPDCGILLNNSSSNVLTNIAVKSNGHGIGLFNGYSNTINNSMLVGNTHSGLYVDGSENNLIYNNFFNNTNNVAFAQGISIERNRWNYGSVSNGTNIIGYWYIAGNYWAKPDGSGYSEICKDEDYDGVCDNAYDVIYDRECGVGTGYACSNNTDYFPLTKPKILKVSFAYNSSVGNNLKEYGKDSLLKYVYALFSDYLSSFVFESGRLISMFGNERNISMWAAPYSRVYFVVTKNIGKEEFEKRVEMVRSREFLGYGRFNFGYELGKKFLVRVILSYDRMVFEGTKILEKGVYRLMIRNIGKNNENVVIRIS